MKYVVEMGSGAMMSNIPSFIKISSGIQKLIGGGGDSQTHRQHADLLSLLLFFKNKESMLIITVLLFTNINSVSLITVMKLTYEILIIL
jgi:hypothetical protein